MRAEIQTNHKKIVSSGQENENLQISILNSEPGALFQFFCISPSRATWSRLLYRRLLLMSHKVKWQRPLSPHCVKRDPNVSINDLKIPINVRQYHWRMHLLPLLSLIGGPLILSGC